MKRCIIGSVALLIGGLHAVAMTMMPADSPMMSVKSIDFKNWAYPWVELSGWPDRLEWLQASVSTKVTLTNGRFQIAADQDEFSYQLPFSGLTLDSVIYADISGDGQEDAIVVLRFNSGGTMYWYYVYIYAMESGRPRLLGGFHTGDRASEGLYKVYGKSGQLVVELYDPRKRIGDCCSSGFIRRRYRWVGGRFEEVLPHEFGVASPQSRRPTSVFGIPDGRGAK